MRSFLSVVLTLFLLSVASGQESFRVYDGKGRASTLEQLLKAVGDSDAVFLGEQHDDAVAHAVQLEIFKRAVAQFSANRKVALSLEMFERDVQTILDEYLKGQISEQHFLLSSRPWRNYQPDYKPLVEFAKEKKLDVIAANAPRRYVNMVSRNGRDALNGLSKDAKRWLAPLPYREPSETYAKKFKALMGSSPEAQMGIDKILASQALWDATMSYAVASYLKKNKKALVINLNGSFHTESRLGTVEHLLKYRPKARVLVVTMRREADFRTFDAAKHTDLGDFVILTASATPPVSLVLDRMQTHNAGLRSLRANLTMVKYDSQLKMTDTYTGHASYLPREAARMYLRVDWIKPVEEQLVVIGNDFELYRPRLNQVIAGSMRSSIRGTSGGVLSLLSQSRSQIEANYSFEFVAEEPVNGVDAWRISLTPKATGSVKQIEIWADRDGMLRQAKVTEQNGDTSTLTLSNLAKNVTLNAQIFRLNYPRSVNKVRM